MSNTLGKKFKLNEVVSLLRSGKTRRASSQISRDLSQALVASESGKPQQMDNALVNRCKSQRKRRSKSKGQVVAYWYCY